MQQKNSGFQFKQFFVQHDRCAMKVGTDSILLGAWADVEGAKRILDLGTGSGLLALMLAQRSAPDCQIVGVELDPAAAQQAAENFTASPWTNRLQSVQQNALDFCQQSTPKFDLIVSNPPYFAQGVDCRDAQREQARYAQQSHLAWLQAAAQCLNDEGKISFVLPFEAANKLLAQLTQKTFLFCPALFCTDFCQIITKQGKSPQRSLLTFSPQAKPLTESQLIIYDSNNQYSADFKQLTKAFYLNF